CSAVGRPRELEPGAHLNLLSLLPPPWASGGGYGRRGQTGGRMELVGYLQEEGPAFREEKGKPRQIQLARVHLGLRKIGIGGEYRRHLGSHSVGDINAWTSLPYAARLLKESLTAAHGVGTDLEPQTLLQTLDARQAAGAT